MKHIRVILALAAAVCLVCLTAVAFADGESADQSALINELRTVPNFKFRNHTDGIGHGKAPVYTAPYEYAFRAANGNAYVVLDDAVSESNFVNGWLLVRYEVGKGERTRVGYIPGNLVSNFKSSMPAVTFASIPLTAADTIPVTDDPVIAHEPFTMLNAGDTFYVLRKYTYTGNWYYIECSVNGQPARGFLDRTKASFYLGAQVDPASGAQAYTLASLGYPETSPRGTAQIGQFVLYEGERKPVRNEGKIGAKQLTVAYPGRYYACYDKTSASGGWYYIWVEEDSTWGWISSANGTLKTN